MIALLQDNPYKNSNTFYTKIWGWGEKAQCVNGVCEGESVCVKVNLGPKPFA